MLRNKILEYADHRIEKGKRKKLSAARLVIDDLKRNRNWSWYRELEFRNMNNLSSVALFYRGYTYSYDEMFNKMNEYGKALRNMGIKRQMKVLSCLPNIPEFVFLLGAVSMIGAIVNSFSAHFEKSQISEILEGNHSGILFLEDNEYECLKEKLATPKIKKIILVSLSDSLVNGIDPYADYDKPYETLFVSKVEEYKRQDERIMSIRDFVEVGKNYTGEVIDYSITMDDPFTISYSSGSTSTRSKGLVHAAKSFIIATRFHDPEVNHTPSFSRFSMMASIPTYSSTDLISGISDALTQGCKLALEPIGRPEFVVEMLLINRPSYLDFTRNIWLAFAKRILFDKKYDDVRLPELLICFSVGEPTEINEEKLINKALKKVGAGRATIPLPISLVKLSIAGGSTENGGFYYKLFRAYSNYNPIHLKRNEEAGVKEFSNIDVDIVDENGNHCKPYQIGTLIARSEIDMLEYENMPIETEKCKICTADGEKYYNCRVNAYFDLYGGLHIRGRQEEDNHIYRIAEAMLLDRKNILSCEVEKFKDIYIVHTELYPGKRNKELVLISAEKRIHRAFGGHVRLKIVYRVFDDNKSFDFAHSGKRLVKREGLTKDCLVVKKKNGKLIVANAIENV